MSEISTTEPLSIRAGDLVQWQISDSDYPASESYTLKYYLTKAGETLIELTAEASGDDHLVTVTAATSADYSPGVYTFQGRIEKDTTIKTIRNGIIQIYRDVSADGMGVTLTGALVLGDPRLELQFLLGIKANILDLLAGKVLEDNQTYAVKDRSLAKYTFSELIQFERYVDTKIAALKRRLGLKRKSTIKIRF